MTEIDYQLANDDVRKLAAQYATYVALHGRSFNVSETWENDNKTDTQYKLEDIESGKDRRCAYQIKVSNYLNVDGIFHILVCFNTDDTDFQQFQIGNVFVAGNLEELKSVCTKHILTL